jgi:16S rRNA (guanine966-N2)-methyltransferase
VLAPRRILARPDALDTPGVVGKTPRLPVRVIAGYLGGRRIAAPRGRATRPTSDRVREALFMTLEPLRDARIVDLFAGSGALGIEALSRGAARVDFVDSDPAARAAIAANLETLELGDRTRVWPLALPRGLKRIAAELRAADLVFMDPPYGGEAVRETLDALGEPGVLGPAARVVAECHAKDLLPEAAGRLRRRRRRQYGETVVSLYGIEADSPGAGIEEEER